MRRITLIITGLAAVLLVMLAILTWKLVGDNEILREELEAVRGQYQEAQDEIEKLKDDEDASISEILSDTQESEKEGREEAEMSVTDKSDELAKEAEIMQPSSEASSLTLLPAGEILNEGDVDLTKVEEYFTAVPISEEILDRINGKSFRENPDIALDQLRYLKVIHYNFQHQTQIGELIVNAQLAEVFCEIFKELYQAEYEIFSMYLIDNYWTGDGDSSDTASIEANNTSAFCYRNVTGGGDLSNHALGKAIDINPQQNPYVSYVDGQPQWYHSNANDYIDRTTDADHMITQGDVCYEIFAKYGFTWGGEWEGGILDYQHFEHL